MTRRLGRLALSALFALLAVAPPALVSGPALASAPVELSAKASPAAVVYPEKAVVTGVISIPGATVTLLARPASGGEWTEQTSSAAGAGGAFRFIVAPAVSTEYRVVHEEDGSVVAQADATVRVRPRLTTQFPTSFWLGGSVVLRGRVAPAHPGETVDIDRRISGSWQPLLTVTLDADSRFAIRWTPTSFGYYRLRARMDADAEHDTGVAASERTTVNRPNAHRVPMRFAHYIVIVRHEFRLYYYEHGALVRRFDVALGRPGYRTPLGRFRVYGKRKPAAGALGSCAMFYRRKGGIAIHGTNRPGLIRRPAPRAFSHGCARMLNHQALWLYKRVPVGTRVRNLR